MQVFLRVYGRSKTPSTLHTPFVCGELLSFTSLWPCLSTDMSSRTMPTLSNNGAKALLLRPRNLDLPMFRRIEPGETR